MQRLILQQNLNLRHYKTPWDWYIPEGLFFYLITYLFVKPVEPYADSLPENNAEKEGMVIPCDDLPKSFVLTAEYGLSRVHLTSLNSYTLEKRLK